jgi:catechol 2,3-dioxygenase-like lactoylglutathione lyase family enzyme
MKLTGVMHTGFTVSDMERSIRFYRDTLGMQLVRRQEGTAPYLANVTGFPGVRLQIQYFQTWKLTYVNARFLPRMACVKEDQTKEGTHAFTDELDQ